MKWSHESAGPWETRHRETLQRTSRFTGAWSQIPTGQAGAAGATTLVRSRWLKAKIVLANILLRSLKCGVITLKYLLWISWISIQFYTYLWHSVATCQMLIQFLLYIGACVALVSYKISCPSPSSIKISVFQKIASFSPGQSSTLYEYWYSRLVSSHPCNHVLLFDFCTIKSRGPNVASLDRLFQPVQNNDVVGMDHFLIEGVCTLLPFFQPCNQACSPKYT